MTSRDHEPRRDPAPPADADGVRIVEGARDGAILPRWALGAIALFVVAIAAWLLLVPSPLAAARGGAAAPPAASAGAPAAPRHHSTTTAAGDAAAADDAASGDPADLAAQFRPGDPEPTGAELIGALHDAGIRTGIGAFNPPGTSPPLEGLAVPADFVLPPGYVRHHQFTDAGEPIAPILMFAPDIALHDADGHPVAIPGDRVVPEAMAPPGLPLRRVRIPSQ